ncbi:hypothetical protein FB567DRAFT_553692 [Paraphoma chrysanthemicola]|uniref:Uncharacterized protein n=1 Tax=Paraphoma chrysanthemicola TaxID=798071 RepID=A0A8K0QW80_9PLEO|nr:hypothetical protein FB567DRAFT_553692 [Paraphoma chrysanthemicola]
MAFLLRGRLSPGRSVMNSPSFRQFVDTQLRSAAAFEAISSRPNAQRVERVAYRRPVPEQSHCVPSRQQNRRGGHWLTSILVHMSASLPDHEEFENRAIDLVRLLKIAVPLFRDLRHAHSIFGFRPALANLGWEWDALRAVQSQLSNQYQLNRQLSCAGVMIVETLEEFAKESGMWIDPACKIGTTHLDFQGSEDEMDVDQDFSSILASSFASMGVSASLTAPKTFDNMSDFTAALNDMDYTQHCETEATQLLIKARNPSLPVSPSDFQYIAHGLASFLASKKQAWWLFDINAIFATCREWFDGVTGLREQLNAIDKLIMQSKGEDLREFRVQLRKVQKVVKPFYAAEKRAQHISSSPQQSSQTTPPPAPPPSPPPSKPSDEMDIDSSGMAVTSASALNFSTTNFAPSSKPGTFKSAVTSTQTASVTSSPALVPSVAPTSTPQQPPSSNMSISSFGVQNGVAAAGVNFSTNFAPSSRPGTFNLSANSTTSAAVASATAAQTVPPPASAPPPTPAVPGPADAPLDQVKTFTGAYDPALITSNDILKSFFANSSLEVLLYDAHKTIADALANDNPLQSKDTDMHWNTCQLLINASTQPWFNYKILSASNMVVERSKQLDSLQAVLEMFVDNPQQARGQCQLLRDQLLTFDKLLRAGSLSSPADPPQPAAHGRTRF